VLLHINGGDLASLPAIGFGGRASLPGRLRLRLALAGATRVTTPSTAMVAAAAALGVRAERLTFGVSTDRWPARSPAPRPHGTPLRLLSVGSINRVKDHGTLLHALVLLRQQGLAFELVCVGKDTLGGEVQRQAVRLGLSDCVTFCGFLPQSELRPHFERAHALVVHSLHEADPIAALEAALAGLAVVGTRVGHLAEWAPAGAVTCEPGDARGLAAVITQVAEDDALRQQLARAAQASALLHHAGQSAQRVRELYQELIHDRG
jgi:glycosyltransferase involved in cell wall biosynthesis